MLEALYIWRAIQFMNLVSAYPVLGFFPQLKALLRSGYLFIFLSKTRCYFYKHNLEQAAV